MFSIRYLVCVLLGGAALLAVAAGDSGGQVGPGGKKGDKQVKEAKPGDKVPKELKPAAPAVPTENVTIQEFPSNSEGDTAWKVRWYTKRGFGLIIKDAYFRRARGEQWIQILGDARVSEIFVPYHKGDPRFWDVSYQFRLCTATPDDAGAFGKLLRDATSPQDDRPTVIQEIRDRGLAWKSSVGSRRGQALVLWGCLEAANYRYIMEYSFADDGQITFRMGSTGDNYGSRVDVGHMHNALWRIDVNLGGADNNSVYTVEHIEPLADAKLKARTDITPFNGGKEGYLDWNAEKFTMLRVVNDKVKNKHGEPLAYDLMSPRWGNARHHGGGNEECTLHDFWVTRAKPNEMNYTKVGKFVDGESVMNTDVVLWHSTPSHHDPRREDGRPNENGSGLHGTAHVAWSTFVLKPRNLFDQTPMYPYDSAGRRPRGK